jgi:hypothetical protein
MGDTAGNEIIGFISPCPARCSSTVGCESCNPALRRPYECKHDWQPCSEVVEHCPNCGRHRKIGYA